MGPCTFWSLGHHPWYFYILSFLRPLHFYGCYSWKYFQLLYKIFPNPLEVELSHLLSVVILKIFAMVPNQSKWVTHQLELTWRWTPGAVGTEPMRKTGLAHWREEEMDTQENYACRHAVSIFDVRLVGLVPGCLTQPEPRLLILFLTSLK